MNLEDKQRCQTNWRRHIQAVVWEHHKDVEILCSTGAVVAAHRLVLCACSEVLREALIRVKPALSSTSSPVLMLLDTDKQDLECLLDFMYRGEALVSQERLQSFLNLAEKLKVTKVLPSFCGLTI